MEAEPNLEAERPCAVPNRACARDRAGGAVERGQEAVAGGVQLAAPETGKLTADECVVLVEQVPPTTVASEKSDSSQSSQRPGRGVTQPK
jgi:hypothetical protein